MTNVFNRSSEKPLRQHLRKQMPPAEVLLWMRLRGRQLAGVKFRRQHSVGPYCLDFFDAEHRLAIEVDGDSHFTEDGRQHDERRRRFLEDHGIRTLRFTNADVFENLDGVIERVLHEVGAGIASPVPEDRCGRPIDPPVSPLGKGGKE